MHTPIISTCPPVDQNSTTVIPAKTGTQGPPRTVISSLGSRLRGNDVLENCVPPVRVASATLLRFSGCPQTDKHQVMALLPIRLSLYVGQHALGKTRPTYVLPLAYAAAITFKNAAP